MTPNDRNALNSAMLVTVWVAALLFFLKIIAYMVSGSAAILGDAAESVVHLVAILFAAYSLYLTEKAPDPQHPYGFSKISFFSSGFEGALIIFAGLVTIWISSGKLFGNSPVHEIELGTGLITIAAAINALLGVYLLNLGKKRRSLIVESNGKHVLVDSYTSIAAVVGLLLYNFTGLRWLDPLFGIGLAIYIIITGAGLFKNAFEGLMDKADPVITRQLTELLSQRCAHYGIDFHELRHRNAGDRHMVDVHLIFPSNTEIADAHRIASEIEISLIGALSNRAQILTHLESAGTHDSDHHSKRNIES